MKRVAALLIALALLAGTVGCPAAPVEVELEILSTSGGSVTVPGEGKSTHDVTGHLESATCGRVKCRHW